MKAKPSVKYGDIFEDHGAMYIKFEGGALLVEHAIERANDLGRSDVADKLAADIRIFTLSKERDALLNAARYAAVYIVQSSEGLDNASLELRAAHRTLRKAIALAEGQAWHGVQPTGLKCTNCDSVNTDPIGNDKWNCRHCTKDFYVAGQA